MGLLKFDIEWWKCDERVGDELMRLFERPKVESKNESRMKRKKKLSDTRR